MKISLISLQHEIPDTNMEAEAPCSVPGDISRAVAGAGRGNYQAAVQEDQEGRGQGAGGRGGRARNADSVDTELTGGDMGHGMGTRCSISPHYGPEQSSLSVFHAL